MVRRRKRRSRARRYFVLLTAIVVTAGWFRYGSYLLDLFGTGPPGMIIHHSASPPRVGNRMIDARALDRMHARRGFTTWYKGKIYHIGYHFVVLPDGTVQEGRPVGCRGAHTHGRSEYNRYIGICLVGNFSSRENRRGEQGPTRPTRAQMKGLTSLCARLMGDYGIDLKDVKRHRDFNQTECPGDRFPYKRFITDLCVSGNGFPETTQYRQSLAAGVIRKENERSH